MRGVPSLQFVFLRIQVFLAAGLPRPGLAKLEGRPIDAVVGAQGRGQHQAQGEGGPPPALQELGQNVRGVGPQVRAEEFLRLPARELGEIFLELPLAIAPGEVGVGLGESALRQVVHDLGAREGLGEEEDFRMLFLDFADEITPKSEGLGVGIVDAEDADSLLDPKIGDALQFLPKLGPVRPLEIQGVNVLVFLGRILRVLDAAIGTMLEPFRMLPDVGMVGRALIGEVQGKL